MMRLRVPLLVLVALLPGAERLLAQDPAQVEALAPVLMAEDRRAFDAAVLTRALNDPDPLIRQVAVLSVGRLGDARGTRLIAPLLADSDMTVVANTFFALGLLRDTNAVALIVARLHAPATLRADAVDEAATALTRIGGSTAARFVAAVLNGTADVPSARQAQLVPNALLDGWHLGPLMPAQAMIHFSGDTSTDLRWRTIYSLGRMRVPAAGEIVARAIRDRQATIREIAAKWLVKRFVDTAGLVASAVEADLVRSLSDEAAGIRINAMVSLATFADSNVASKVSPLLSDADPNVRVAAVSTLGELKGSVAVKALDGVMDRRDALWPMRRNALTALARLDTADFARRAAAWLASSDFRDRTAALQAWGSVAPADAGVFRAALNDADARVQAAALDAWRSADAAHRRASPASGDTALISAARARLRAPSIFVRTAAAGIVRGSVTLADLDLLAAAWRQGIADNDSDARLALLATLRALSRREPDLLARLDDPSRREILQRPADPLLLAEAARSWPELAQRWGDPRPIDTHRSLDDYRGLVRTYLLAPVDPTVTIDVEGRGSVQVELLAHEAPLTVANFLRLVDGRKFDGNRWHRVVPNFVVQDGDPTGTGSGGPGWSIRDEINRERYNVPMLGMALSGPDTGGSQWFINLSAQPHLDGQYTIFGKVTGSYNGLNRIVQGDLIRSIHR